MEASADHVRLGLYYFRIGWREGRSQRQKVVASLKSRPITQTPIYMTLPSSGAGSSPPFLPPNIEVVHHGIVLASGDQRRLATLPRAMEA